MIWCNLGKLIFTLVKFTFHNLSHMSNVTMIIFKVFKGIFGLAIFLWSCYTHLILLSCLNQALNYIQQIMKICWFFFLSLYEWILTLTNKLTWSDIFRLHSHNSILYKTVTGCSNIKLEESVYRTQISPLPQTGA
jgi:hypothetical protein